MKKLKKQIYVLFVTLTVLVAVCLSSCVKSPQPPCGKPAAWICIDNTTHQCDGQNWQPNIYCDDITLLGAPVETNCKIISGMAECVEVTDE